MNLIIKQANSFKRSIKNLSKQHKAVLDEEVRKLVNNPQLGERKKGDLDFLRVHKMKLFNQDMLLGYIEEKDKILLTLLRAHETFCDTQIT